MRVILHAGDFIKAKSIVGSLFKAGVKSFGHQSEVERSHTGNIDPQLGGGVEHFKFVARGIAGSEWIVDILRVQLKIEPVGPDHQLQNNFGGDGRLIDVNIQKGLIGDGLLIG